MAGYSVSTSQAGGGPPQLDTGGVYPRSRVSQSAAESIIRSRTWSDDITKNWNEAVPTLETVADRVSRYIVYFSLTPDQLRVLVDRFHEELKASVEFHRDAIHAALRGSPTVGSADGLSVPSSLLCLDSFIPDQELPRGTEKGAAVAIDFSGPFLQAGRVTLKGKKEIALTNVQRYSLRDDSAYPLGLMDKHASASELFDVLSIATVQAAAQDAAAAGGAAESGSTGSPGSGSCAPATPVGIAIGFPCEQRGQDSATLLNWTKGFQTGRSTNDGVEGMDIAALLTCALARRESNARVRAAVNDAVATLVASCYEVPNKAPAPRMAMIMGGGVNASYLQPDAEPLGYVGSVVNCEIGSFDKSLPLNDVDLEVDFADAAGRGQQLFEKMTATTYLGELCRRLIVKVWQNEAPQLSWVRYSMPWTACAKIVEDTDAGAADEEDGYKLTGEILRRLWEWETTVEERKTVRRLFEVVFDRAAALCSVALVAIAQRTEKLQPAMGGLTCAIGGDLVSRTPRFVEKVRKNLALILGDSAGLLALHAIENGPLKGAGILATM